MARGPFQGTFNPNVRPTVVTAPDAVVYINGETDVIGCPNCSRKFDFNKYITSIQVDLSVDSVPGSANISMSIPRHAIDDFYFDGVPILSPMMEIEIFAKGYYLVEGIPQYYPIFWGMIGDVSDNYSGGEHTVSITCHDILKWWEICKMNVNPSFTAPSGQQGRSIFGNVFFGKNPYDTIWSLAQQSFGDVIIGTGSLISLYKENGQKQTFNAALTDIMLYWIKRFRRIRSGLLLYGVNGVAVRGDTLFDSYRPDRSVRDASKKNRGSLFASSAVALANGGPDAGQMVFDPADPGVTAFRTQFSMAGQVNFWQSEYQTKLEIANAAKEAIGFEFFMDVDGSIVFKPPFYNLDIVSNKPVSWIQDIDIIDWNLSESESEVITQLTLQGSFGGNVDYGFGEEATPFTSVTDYHLLRKFGWRADTYNSEFMASPLLMYYHGLDIMDRKNSRRHRGTVSIPLRPELRLGYPIYIAPKDQVWYITGISHNISFGGRAQTTLTLSARRQKFLAPNGISTLSSNGFSKGAKVVTNPGGAAFQYSSRTISKSALFTLKVGEAASIPPVNADSTVPGDKDPYAPLILRHPKTGRLLGYPNVVMVYTRPFSESPDGLDNLTGQKRPGSNPYTAKAKKQAVETAGKKLGVEQQKVLDAADADGFIDKAYNNRYQYGLNSAGVYVYAYEPAKLIGELVLLKTSNIQVKDQDPKTKFFEGKTAMIRPVSDERGFEVVGHFRYGRGVALRDGRLVLNNGQTNAAANIDTQVALAGGLFETLTAQSQGLTTVVSAYPNPIEALAHLQPEDLQTAGAINPDTKKPQLVTSDPNFVDAAPLGSPQAQGVPVSVEASQLSRALTLAEMTVKDNLTTGDQNCVCMLGRSDLAFITVGYTFKTINAAQPAASGLFATPNTNPGITNLPNPVPGSEFPSGTELITRVDQFLTDLYTALDGPHQDFERQIRTGGIPPGPTEDTGDLNAPTTQFGDLQPPFSAPERFALGDTKQILGDISSSVQSAGAVWNNLGKNLKANAQKAALTSKIGQEQSELGKLQTQLASLQKQKGGGSVVIGAPSIDDQIASLKTDIAKAQQNIANDQAALAQIGTGG